MGPPYLSVEEAVEDRHEEALQGRRGAQGSAGTGALKNKGQKWVRRVRAHLEGLQEGVEVYEDDVRQAIITRVDKEEHVGDAKQRQEDQGGFHCFPKGQEGAGWAFRKGWGSPRGIMQCGGNLFHTHLYWTASDVVDALSLVIRILTMLKRKIKLICVEETEKTLR